MVSVKMSFFYSSWTALFLAVLFLQFGLQGFILIILVPILFCVGFIGYLIYESMNSADAYKHMLSKSRLELPQLGIKQVVENLNVNNAMAQLNEYRFDKRYTGSALIDQQIQEIIEFIFRDYVKGWYCQLSDHPEFLYELHQVIQILTVNLAARFKEVDWIPYLTRNLVDDVATHLRLFTQARTLFKKKCESGISNDGNKAVSFNIESVFFDLEAEMEKTICRDLVCSQSDTNQEISYLRDISETLLCLLLSTEQFQCKLMRRIGVNLLSDIILLPIVNLLSNPDYVNQIIIWIFKDVQIGSDVFLNVLRTSDSTAELLGTNEFVEKEIAYLRSRDSDNVKDQLSSLNYVRRIIELRIQRLQDGISDSDSSGLPSQIDWNRLQTPDIKLFNLPLDVTLKNNVALSYFMDYLTLIGEQHYLFLYLNIEGWRVSAEQQISAIELQQLTAKETVNEQNLDGMREAAQSIYDQYLAEEAQLRCHIDESLIHHLQFSIRTEPVSELWFDDIQNAIYFKLMDDRFYVAFKKTTSYIKLLAELDLLNNVQDDDVDTHSNDDNESLASVDFDDESSSERDLCASERHSGGGEGIRDLSPGERYLSAGVRSCGEGAGERDLSAIERVETDILRCSMAKSADGVGKTYALYEVAITLQFKDGREEKWTVHRRYSDFYDFHEKLIEKHSHFSQLTFPGKKAFSNKQKAFLEKRKTGLNTFLRMLTRPDRLETPGVLQMLMKFLDSGHYERQRGNLEKTVDSIVQPIRASVRSVGSAVKSVPDNFLQTIDDFAVIFNRAILRQTTSGGNQLTATTFDPTINKTSLTTTMDESEDTPVRIVLLLLEEVFELRSRSQWLRRRLVIFLRQIVHTMFGEIMNRKIEDAVADMTAQENVAEYIELLKNTLWPNGQRIEPRPELDENTRMRTRVAAKTVLQASVSDELKHLLGSETTRRGLNRVFELGQNSVLNRRLCYVVLEGIIQQLFPDYNFNLLIHRLHGRSTRLSNNDELKSSKRKDHIKRY